MFCFVMGAIQIYYDDEGISRSGQVFIIQLISASDVSEISWTMTVWADYCEWCGAVCSHNTEKVVYFLLLDRKLRNPSKDDEEDIKAKSECGNHPCVLLPLRLYLLLLLHFCQPLVDDEFVTRCLRLLRSLAESVAVLIVSPRSAMSSLMLSVHLYGCLLSFRVPSIWQCIALAGSRIPSILVKWPNCASCFFNLSTSVFPDVEISLIPLSLWTGLNGCSWHSKEIRFGQVW